MAAEFSHSFKVGSDYKSGNRTRYFLAIGPANQTMPHKRKTTPTSIMTLLKECRLLLVKPLRLT